MKKKVFAALVLSCMALVSCNGKNGGSSSADDGKKKLTISGTLTPQ